jgi:hypothetical protein
VSKSYYLSHLSHLTTHQAHVNHVTKIAMHTMHGPIMLSVALVTESRAP